MSRFLIFRKTKNEIGDYVDCDFTILKSELETLLSAYEYNTDWELHGSVSPGHIKVILLNDAINQTSVSDAILLHGSQEQVDARAAAIVAEDSENDNLFIELSTLVDNMTCDGIDTHITNVFGTLTANQQNSFKNLYKVVLFMAKKARR